MTDPVIDSCEFSRSFLLFHWFCGLIVDRSMKLLRSCVNIWTPAPARRIQTPEKLRKFTKIDEVASKLDSLRRSNQNHICRTAVGGGSSHRSFQLGIRCEIELKYFSVNYKSLKFHWISSSSILAGSSWLPNSNTAATSFSPSDLLLHAVSIAFVLAAEKKLEVSVDALGCRKFN